MAPGHPPGGGYGHRWDSWNSCVAESSVRAVTRFRGVTGVRSAALVLVGGSSLFGGAWLRESTQGEIGRAHV